MWSTFPLTKVGIPEPNEENKCKIVWTTRSKKVCRGMGSQRTIKVDGLTRDESWTLFKEKLGANFVLSPEIEPIAKAVVEECDGLPLGIITVGAAMRGEDDIRIWRNALEDLKNSRPDLEGLEDDVFSCLKFSFDHLKTQIHRDCFLYCALYPEDDQIACDSLIEYWMADGFFDEIEDRDKGFDKGCTIINDLKDACMLENAGQDCFSRSHVKMHDLLRDLAISIKRKSRQFVVEVRSNVGKFPRDENLMDDVIRVSLMHSGIQMLSCQSKCPKLSTLLLEGSRLCNIDHLFFEHMQNLRVLDLSNTPITVLPQSLSKLVNLHALLLRDCYKMTEVPSLAQLRELRVLDLTGTPITYLPDGMDSLTNLRCLHLSFTKLKMVPVGTISSLSHLEELSMVNSEWKWSSNENRNGRGAGVEDIVTLVHLKKLLVEFQYLSAFSSYVGSGHWRGLNCFVLTVGCEAEFDVQELPYNFYCRERRVCVSGMLQQAHNMNSVAFPGSLTDLEIIGLHDSRTTYMEEPTQGDNLANLKKIHISICPKLKYVFSVGWFQTLQNLEEIIVEGCQAMEEMVVDTGLHKEEPTQGDTLANLKHIRISDCPKLKYVLSVGRFQTLQNLEEIIVEGCQAMEEVVVDTGLHKEEPTRGDTLANLKHIRILYCPKLKYVLLVGWFQTHQNLEEIRVYDCLAMEEMVVDISLHKEEPTQGDTLANLKHIHISNCPKLKYLFSVGWFQSLQNLEEIIVEGCQAMEEVVVDTGLHKEEPTRGDTLANVKYIHISNCPKLKYVLSVGWFQTLQNLEQISVYHCPAMEEMVVDMGDMGEANSNITITLPRLKRLELSCLRNLKSICKRTLICGSLGEIEVDSCPMLKTLPFCINGLPSSLKQIAGSTRWWDSLEWDNANTKMHLQPFFSELEEDQDFSDFLESGSELEEDQDFSDSPDYGFQLEEDQERQHLQFSERPDYGFQREEDQERQGTKRKADSIGMFERPLLDLINFPPRSLVQQHGESEPRELSPRNWQLWKRHE